MKFLQVVKCKGYCVYSYGLLIGRLLLMTIHKFINDLRTHLILTQEDINVKKL